MYAYLHSMAEYTASKWSESTDQIQLNWLKFRISKADSYIIIMLEYAAELRTRSSADV